MSGAFPSGYDVFLLANLIHYWSPHDNRALLQRVRSAAEAGSHLPLVDFWTNPTHTEPPHAMATSTASMRFVHGWTKRVGASSRTTRSPVRRV